MGTITSGVGLISGMDIEATVKALMQIEARPKQLLENRVATLVSQRTAYLQINAMVLAAKSAAASFGESSFFKKAKAVSSNENVISATASDGAMPGSYSFTVHSLVSTHQMVSSGFSSIDSARVGAGTMTLESSLAQLGTDTPLAMLNGGAGVGRGSIRITDRSGASTEVDLSAAATMNDVLDAINAQTVANVTASVSGGRIVLTDNTGQAATNLTVTNVGLGQTASDLGIATTVASNVLTGSNVIYVTDETGLSLLNDGNGVRRDGTFDDFRITLRDGSTIDVNLSGKLKSETSLSALHDGAGVELGTIKMTARDGTATEVDLSGATTIADVMSTINATTTTSHISATVINSHILITDSSGGEGTLKIEDVTGGAAEGLGIAQESEATTIEGSDIYGVDTLGDVLRAINLDSENTGTLVASIGSGGTGIVLTDTSSGTADTTVEALDDGQGHFSLAARDLGILGSSATGTIESGALIAGLNTVLIQSLNGGSGADLGTIELTARDGTTAQVDLSGLDTLGEVLEAINAVSDTSHISASINSAGNGIVLRDLTSGTGSLIVADVTGSAAADLNIAVNGAVSSVDSGNLQRQYINENTRLDSMNGGQGVRSGKFKITDSSGVSAIVDLTQGNEVTLADVIEEINSRHIGVVASINATGDGLLLTDTAGGANELTVAEEGSTTAADLGILGTAKAGETTIDGSFETRIEIDSDDTLTDVMNKINSSRAGATASILNDGSALNPYRLVLASDLSGRRGEMLVDSGGTRLSFSTLVEARDAVVFLGEAGSPNSIMLTSGSNTFDEVIPNVRLDLLGTSDSPVSVNVSQDSDSLVSGVTTFVTMFNLAIDKIEDLTSFDSETYEKGVLFAESTVQRIQSRLYRMMRTTVENDGKYSRFSDVGLTLGSGAKLQFDEEKFRKALEENREDVELLFTEAETGLGAVLKDELGSITETGSGLIDRHNELLTQQEDLLSTRIDQMQILLDSKEDRLFKQFYAMEQALSQLTNMQSALSSLSALQTQYSSNSSSSS
ncbi:MAG: flagellar filament capping protein FliD [Phycisphaerae bacterium]|nr:flagellar filament capping protein FliD [Phycisphaerae bacterium]